MTISAIFLRNFFFFYLAVIYVATLNVMPQIFFLEYSPANKAELMAFFLTLGTLSAIIGILISHKNIVNPESVFKKKHIAQIFILLIITFSALFAVKNIAPYFLFFIVLKFASSYLYNYLDQYFLKITPQSQTGTHVKASLLYTMIGSIAAPFYLSFFYSNIILNIAVFSAIGIFSMFFAMRNITKNFPNQSYKKDHVSQEPLKTGDWLFITYSAVIYIIVITFSSLVIYFVQDYYHLENAETKGGILIGFTSVISAVSIFSAFFFKKPILTTKINQHIEAKLFPFFSNLFVIFLLLFSVIMFYFKLSDSFIYLIFLSIPTGIGYGLFLNSSRNYASSVSMQLNKQGLLSIYNNLINYGALLSFGIIFLISFLSKHLSFDFYAIILKINIGLVIVAAFIFLLTTLSIYKFR
jgi:hypothetical protein